LYLKAQLSIKDKKHKYIKFKESIDVFDGIKRKNMSYKYGLIS